MPSSPSTSNAPLPLPPLGNPFDLAKMITCPTCGEQINLTPPELHAEQGQAWRCWGCGKFFTPKPGQTYLGL